MLMNLEDRVDAVKEFYSGLIKVRQDQDKLVIFGTPRAATRREVEAAAARTLTALDFHMFILTRDVDLKDRCVITTYSDEDGYGEYVGTAYLVLDDGEGLRTVLVMADVEDVFNLPPLKPLESVDGSGMEL